MKLTNGKKLVILKSIHTAIWLFYVFVLFYILYAGIFDQLGPLLWLAVGAVILEGLLLIFNHWRCPLTIFGYRYSGNHETGFDIFLPKMLAKHTKTIFLTLFLLEMAFILYRVFA